MSKREKIILFFMALSLVYGFYVFVIEPPGKKGAIGQNSNLESLNKFISHVAELTRESLSEIDSYIIEKAPKQWNKDPLLSSDTEFQFKAENTEADVSALKVNIKYTGYLNMGARSLAILNGLEYEEGEELEKGGFIVRKIYPERVIIVIKGQQEEITIPLEEI
ncbi:MAG: hypothetical protein U9R43_08005 [Thermodesulfobacteriota bacterium]|nr:hypothetical protein [Thermodesulfobacteriota bacterium]